jgi:hypothetical protein
MNCKEKEKCTSMLSIQSCMRTTALGVFLATLTVGLNAQTTTNTQQVSSFSVEAPITLAAIQSTLTPNIPANILASITGGAVEIRSRIVMVAAEPPGTNPTLRVNAFLVAPGSPAQTPVAAQSQTLFSYVMRVDQIILSNSPTRGVTFIGTVTTNDMVSPFGSLVGATIIVSTGYTVSGSTTTFSNLAVVAPGLAVIYSARPTGTLTLAAGAGGGTGGTPGNRAPIAVAGPQGLVTTLPEVQLDASASSDPDGDPITFSWKSVGRPVNILDANTAKPRVQLFGNGFGDYTFEVTVTDNRGASSTARVTISYNGQ